MAGRGGSQRNTFRDAATGSNNTPVQSGGGFGSKPAFNNTPVGGRGDQQQADVKPPVGFNAQQNTQPQGFNAQKPAGFGTGGQQGFNAQPAGFGTTGQKPAGFGTGAPQTSRFGAASQQQSNTSGFGPNTQQSGPSTFQGNKASTASATQGNTSGEGQEHREARIGRIGGYIPKPRDVDVIYKEDEQSKALYSTVFQTDEAVIVQGAGDSIACLDNWTDIVLNQKIMENIQKAGYIHPRKIQSYSIPLILDGLDLKSQAETGSGKSAAFLIPLIHMIALEKEKVTTPTGPKNRPYALIIEPTRELALQLYEQARKLAYNTNVQVVKCYGKYDVTANGKEILQGCDIIVATPGRLLDFVKSGTIDVTNLKYFVLDEADRLISDPGFIEVIREIRGVSTYPPKEKIQTLLFSATFQKEVEELAKELLKEKCAFVHNERTVAANSKVEQTFVECPSEQKKIKVLEILEEELKNVQLKDAKATQPRTLVFVQKRSDADLMALFLSDQGINTTTINGDRPQRERERALESFRSNTTPVLVATDVCARGLDIKDLDFVINMDLPQDVETFVHRIGRTGRLKQGKATTLFDVSTDQRLAAGLVKLLEEGKKTEVPGFLRSAASSINSTNFGGNAGGFGAQAQSNAGGFGAKSFGAQSSNAGGFGAQPSNTGGFGAKGFGAQPSNTGGFGAKGFGAQPSNTGGFGAKGFGAQPSNTGGFGSHAQSNSGGFGSQGQQANTGGFGTKGFGTQQPAATGFGSQPQSSSATGF